jgi:hypothetical protein
MGGRGPQRQVGEDLLEDLGLGNTGNDPHRSFTPGAEQRIGLIDLLDQLAPALFEGRSACGWGDCYGPFGGYFLRLMLCLFPFSTAGVAVPTVVSYSC